MVCMAELAAIPMVFISGLRSGVDSVDSVIHVCSIYRAWYVRFDMVWADFCSSAEHNDVRPRAAGDVVQVAQ